MLTFGLSQRPQNDGCWIENDQIWLRWQDQTRAVMPVSTIRLRGSHNLSNVLAACCLTTAAGAPPATLAESVSTFTGVEHRLEEVGRRSDVLWVNDSIATSPERSLAALRSFDEPLILLAGGRDKHLPWQDWAKGVQQHVRQVITFGDAATLIEAGADANPARLSTPIDPSRHRSGRCGGPRQHPGHGRRCRPVIAGRDQLRRLCRLRRPRPAFPRPGCSPVGRLPVVGVQRPVLISPTRPIP